MYYFLLEGSSYYRTCGHIDPSFQITEEELLSKDVITPEDVLRLNKITENYLCPPEANIFGIDFTRYKATHFLRNIHS